MTQLLDRAFRRAAALPETEQDAIASIVLDELESEEMWQRLFDSTPDLLAEMGKRALAEHRAGKTLPLDPDTL